MMCRPGVPAVVAVARAGAGGVGNPVAVKGPALTVQHPGLLGGGGSGGVGWGGEEGKGQQ